MANVFTQFIKGILLSGETSDPGDNRPGSIWYNSTSNRIKSYVESAVRTLVSEDQSQVLTNKDVDGGTASNANRITIPKNTRSALEALTRKQGTLAYDTDLNSLLIDNGTTLSQVNSEQTNYITNSNAEANTSGWVTYSNTAQSSPVTGSGGSPSVTLTRSTVNPLRDLASFIFSKDAVNRQGQGISFDFSTDLADRAKVLSISFDYVVNSGTFNAASSSTPSDVTVWIYDISNARIIQPSSISLFSNSSTISDVFEAQFQTASNSSSYRLILHVGSTNASAFELKLGSIVIKPSSYVFGTPVSDWVSYVPTGTFTNTTYSGRWRRVGDSAEVVVQGILTGTPGAANLNVNLPAGMSVDLSKLLTTITACPVGRGSIVDNGSDTYGIAVDVDASGNIRAVTNRVVTHTGSVPLQQSQPVTNAIPYSFVSGDGFVMNFKVPIVGFSSSVQMSNNASTNIIAASYALTSSQSISGYTDLTGFTTRYVDTTGSFNTANATYTFPTSGVYCVSHNLYFAATSTTGNQYNSRWIINGSTTIDGDIYSTVSTTSSYPRLDHSFIYEFRAGDTIKLQASAPASRTLINTGGQNVISIEKLSGPSAIAATETISLIANTATTVATAYVTPINFTNVVDNSHGAYSAGTFTVPAAGRYLINSSTYSGATNHTIFVYVDGVNTAQGTPFANVTSAAQVTYIGRLNAGQTVQIRSGENATMSGGAGINRLEIIRLGI